MEGKTRAWVPIEPGPPGSYLVHDADGDGWHWEPATPNLARSLRVAAFGCVASLTISLFFYALFH